MKKYFRVGLLVTLLVLSSLHSIYAEEEKDEKTSDLAPEARSAVLLERDTGKVIYHKNEHEQLPPASMAKLMTLLLTMEALDQGTLTLDEKIRISERASSMGGSQVFLEAGEEMTVEDLLKSVAIASGNDASLALAERIAGSEEAFVEQMNAKVKSLGLENTHFKNSSGLPSTDLYSSAYDMAIIAKELLTYEEITDYTSIYEDYLRKGEKNEFWLVNTNKLVRFYEGVDGLKTGYTSEAKYCLTATAEKDDMRVIAVVMGVETVKKRNATISKMLDYAYNHYETEQHFSKGEVVTTVDTLKAKDEKVNVVTSEPIRTIHLKGEPTKNISTEYKLTEVIHPSLQRDEPIGSLLVKDGDEVIFESPLMLEEDLQPASYLTLLKRTLKKLAKNR